MDQKQPEALRLADALQRHALFQPSNDKIAAELRRLHTINTELLEVLKEFVNYRDETHSINDCVPGASDRAWTESVVRLYKLEQAARATIAKAEKE